ncbi:MAG: LemA family protein [Caulobacteraceae bacterium]
MGTLIVFAAIAAVVLMGAIVLFNQLIAKRQMSNNGWADIDVQLKRRADLIPQLVTTVKGYAAHERQLFEDIAEKRNSALAAGDDATRRGAAESELSKPVVRLIALSEAYPDLKANQNFLDLQNELSDTENKIEMARRFYNGAVRELNTAVESFPSNAVANVFGIGKRAFFEIETAADRAVPAIGLDCPS